MGSLNVDKPGVGGAGQIETSTTVQTGASSSGSVGDCQGRKVTSGFWSGIAGKITNLFKKSQSESATSTAKASTNIRPSTALPGGATAVASKTTSVWDKLLIFLGYKLSENQIAELRAKSTTTGSFHVNQTASGKANSVQKKESMSEMDKQEMADLDKPLGPAGNQEETKKNCDKWVRLISNQNTIESDREKILKACGGQDFDVQLLLTTSHGKEALKCYARGALSPEYYNLPLALAKFEKVETMSDQILKKEIKDFYNNFLTEDSPNKVNLPAKLKDTIKFFSDIVNSEESISGGQRTKLKEGLDGIAKEALRSLKEEFKGSAAYNALKENYKF